MTLKQAFIYTIAVFMLLCLVSYMAIGQPRKISLREAVQLSLTNNRNLKVFSLEVDMSHQEIRVAKSQQLPTAGINGQMAHFFEVPAFFGFGTTGNNDKIPYGRFGGRGQASAALYVSQPLFNATTRPGLQYARLQEQYGKLAYADQKTMIVSVLQQTYIQLLVLEERIKLQEESLQRNNKALQDARSLLAQGRALRVDTLRAYTSVKNLEPDLLKLDNAIQTGRQQLKNLIGLDSLQDIELTDSLTLPQPSVILSEAEIYKEARSNRADLQGLNIQQQLADQQIKLAGASKKPVVSLNAQYLVQTQVNRFNYFNAYYPSTPFAAVLVTVPLFSGFRNNAKIQQRILEKQQSQLQTTAAYEELRTEVKRVVAGVHETTARIQTSANVKKTALLSYDITQYRYAKGVASRLELTDAELALTAAQSSYLEAVYDYLSSVIALERTTGKTGE